MNSSVFRTCQANSVISGVLLLSKHFQQELELVFTGGQTFLNRASLEEKL